MTPCSPLDRAAALLVLAFIVSAGGAAPGFAALVALGDRPARHVPHLVLSGIRLTADHLSSR